MYQLKVVTIIGKDIELGAPYLKNRPVQGLYKNPRKVVSAWCMCHHRVIIRFQKFAS